MLVEIEGAFSSDKFALGPEQENILYRFVRALSKNPVNDEALKGFCAVITDKIAIGADAQAYEEFTE